MIRACAAESNVAAAAPKSFAVASICTRNAVPAVECHARVAACDVSDEARARMSVAIAANWLDEARTTLMSPYMPSPQHAGVEMPPFVRPLVEPCGERCVNLGEGGGGVAEISTEAVETFDR